MPEGNLIVADAGGNTIWHATIETGEFEPAAAMPTLTELTGEEPRHGPPVCANQYHAAEDGTLWRGCRGVGLFRAADARQR